MDEHTRKVIDIADSPATRRVGSDDVQATRRVGGELPASGLPLGILAPGAILCGDCVVERTLQPHESRRPGLYLCSAPEGSVVVKVAAVEYPPKAELWRKLATLNHPNVLRTYRTLERDGFFYDVQEYCFGGTLEDRVPKTAGIEPATPEWVSEVFVPQMNAALEYLHEREIIHRDIKPANIYIRGAFGQESLVLADFDISSVLEQSRTSRDTQRVAGTWWYMAPEAFPRFVDDHASNKRGRINRSSDYYSLGVTIIELLLGTTSLHRCELPDLFDFYLQGGRVEIPKGIPGNLALLLRGLLIRNRRTRWGAAEVDRWLQGETSETDLEAIHDDEYYELARASRPYKLNEHTAVDLPSLADAMFHEQEVATEDIITSDVLLNWIGTLDTTVARDVRRDRDNLYMHPALVLHRTIQRCDPSRPFFFDDGTEVLTPASWVNAAIKVMAAQHRESEDLCDESLLQRLEAWLRLKTAPEPELADQVAAIQQTPPKVRFEELVYLFHPEQPYTIMRGLTARTPSEIADLSYGPTEGWKGKQRPACYDVSYQRWYDGALCAWLRQRGLPELAKRSDEIREQLTDEPCAAFETILRLLNANLPPVTVNLDLAEVARIKTIPYGGQRTCTIRYTTAGPGIPFGTLLAQDKEQNVRLDPPIIKQRQGEIHVTVGGKTNGRAVAKHIAPLVFESGIAQLSQPGLTIPYRIEFPLSVAVLRVLLGAGIGAALFGLPRLAASLLGASAPVAIRQKELAAAWQTCMHYDFPFAALVVGLLVFLACAYFGLRIWFAALRRSE